MPPPPTVGRGRLMRQDMPSSSQGCSGCARQEEFLRTSFRGVLAGGSEGQTANKTGAISRPEEYKTNRCRHASLPQPDYKKWTSGSNLKVSRPPFGYRAGFYVFDLFLFLPCLNTLWKRTADCRSGLCEADSRQRSRRRLSPENTLEADNSPVAEDDRTGRATHGHGDLAQWR